MSGRKKAKEQVLRSSLLLLARKEKRRRKEKKCNCRTKAINLQQAWPRSMAQRLGERQVCVSVCARAAWQRRMETGRWVLEDSQRSTQWNHGILCHSFPFVLSFSPRFLSPLSSLGEGKERGNCARRILWSFDLISSLSLTFSLFLSLPPLPHLTILNPLQAIAGNHKGKIHTLTLALTEEAGFSLFVHTCTHWSYTLL